MCVCIRVHVCVCANSWDCPHLCHGREPRRAPQAYSLVDLKELAHLTEKHMCQTGRL